MKTKILWVTGTSAVGKESTIRAILGHPDHPLKQELDLKDSIVLYEPSLVQYPSNRNWDYEVLRSLAQENRTVLIKSQGIDFICNQPSKLREQLEDCDHIFLALDASIGVITNRIRGRNREADESLYVPVDRTSNNNIIIKYARDNEFEIVWFDNSSDDGDYMKLEQPLSG